MRSCVCCKLLICVICFLSSYKAIKAEDSNINWARVERISTVVRNPETPNEKVNKLRRIWKGKASPSWEVKTIETSDYCKILDFDELNITLNDISYTVSDDNSPLFIVKQKRDSLEYKKCDITKINENIVQNHNNYVLVEVKIGWNVNRFSNTRSYLLIRADCIRVVKASNGKSYIVGLPSVISETIKINGKFDFNGNIESMLAVSGTHQICELFANGDTYIGKDIFVKNGDVVGLFIN